MSLVRWDPFREMEEMAERVNRYFGHPALANAADSRKESLGIPYHRVESACGSFVRRFALPEDVDEQKLRAEFKDGVLSVHVPKAEHAQPRSIEVKAA